MRIPVEFNTMGEIVRYLGAVASPVQIGKYILILIFVCYVRVVVFEVAKDAGGRWVGTARTTSRTVRLLVHR